MRKKIIRDEIFLLLSIHWIQNLLWKQEMLKENTVQVSRPQKCLFMHMHEWSSFQNKSQILVPFSFQPKKSQQFKHWLLV